jgi:hypothetical protein
VSWRRRATNLQAALHADEAKDENVNKDESVSIAAIRFDYCMGVKGNTCLHLFDESRQRHVHVYHV